MNDMSQARKVVQGKMRMTPSEAFVETMVSQTFRCDARLDFDEAGVRWKCVIPKASSPAPAH